MLPLLRMIRPTRALIAGVAGVITITGFSGVGATDIVEALAILTIYLASVLAHELSHAVVARLAGMTVDAVRVSLVGGATCYSGADPGPRVLRRIALAGPKTSLLVALGCLLVRLALGLVNLLPVGSLDGAAIRSAGRARR
jgi:Zn-dependent protease